MEMEQRHVRRYGIFFFFDSEGVVDRYIPYMLKDVSENLDGLTVVCNEFLNEEGREALSAFTDDIYVRQNFGFDVWAYKEAMAHVGMDRLAEYDEVLLFNFTMMGPFFPSRIMFDEMSRRDNDFWGISINHGSQYDPYGLCKWGYLPVYLPTNFIVIKKRMFNSEHFRTYWDTMHSISSVGESICYHEAVFTKHFADLGYKWDVYSDTRDMLDHSNYPMIREPLYMLQQKKVPMVKRKSFFYEYENLQSNTDGAQARLVMEYLRQHTDYDTSMIWENMLRTQNMADLVRTNQLFFTLSDTEAAQWDAAGKIAVICHIHDLERLDAIYDYLAVLPDVFDLYIVTTSENSAAAIKEKFAEKNWNRLTVLLNDEAGREVSSLFITMRPYIMQYDYACFIHSKTVKRYKRTVKGNTAFTHCMENVVKSAAFFNNVLALFDEQPNLGVLCPPPVYFGDYYKNSANEWGKEFERVSVLAERWNIKVNINSEKEPIAPTGFMFWFRPKALKTMFTVPINRKNFEKNKDGRETGSYRRVLQKMVPFVAQSHGYFTGYSVSQSFANGYMLNLHHLLREQNVALHPFFESNDHREFLWDIRRLRLKRNKGNAKIYLKSWLKEILPDFVLNLIRRCKY